MQASAPAPRKYLKTQKEYAADYGKSLPTIKRWWKVGYPLDDPDAMGEYLSSAGRKTDAERAGEFDEDDAGDDDRLAEERLKRFGPEFMLGEGLLAEITRLRRAAKHAAEQYAHARAAKERSNRLAEWMSLLDVLRKIEKDNPEILRENARTLPIEEVATGVTRLLFDIFGRLDMIPLRGRKSLVGLDALDIQEELEREVERIKEPIRKCLWIPEEERAKLPVPESGTTTRTTGTEDEGKGRKKKRKPPARRKRK